LNFEPQLKYGKASLDTIATVVGWLLLDV